MGEEQSPHDAGEGAGQRHQNDERVRPALEIHDQKEVNQQRADDQSESHAGERRIHAVHLAAHEDVVAGSEFLLCVRHDLVHFAGHRAEIAARHIREDVKHGLDVVMIHHAGGIAAREAGEIGQQLAFARVRARHPRRDRHVHQGIDRIQ